MSWWDQNHRRARAKNRAPGDADFNADPDFAKKYPGNVCHGPCGAPNKALCVCDPAYDRLVRSVLAHERRVEAAKKGYGA